MKKIILTGGGTAGHIAPNMAIIPSLKENGYEINYIGGKTGMEKDLIPGMGISYYGISSGKLRRYMDIKNFTDTFRVAKGYFEALSIIKKINPHIIFSKGGFVTVPVCLAAKTLNIPLIIHESDITPGLANRISMPFAKVICTSFPETAASVKKGVLTGIPIRQELFCGDKKRGALLCGFSCEKPVILIIGGSQGSVKINAAIREALPALLKSYNIAHICGKGNTDKALNQKGYAQFEYLGPELRDIYALCDIVISRSGANSIYEFLSLKKPNLLIPLSKAASRGDQILNAASFEKRGYSKVLYEEELTGDSLRLAIIDLYSTREKYIKAMGEYGGLKGTEEVIKVILKYSN